LEPACLLTASCGETALELAQRNRPHLIVLDIMLKGMDGLEVLQVLKGSQATRDIPVLVITAFPEGASRALNLGANGILVKPFPNEHFLQRVQSLLNEPSAPQPR